MGFLVSSGCLCLSSAGRCTSDLVRLYRYKCGEANPVESQVQEAFEKYLVALNKLFDAHKDTCLPPEVAARGLKVVVRGARASSAESGNPRTFAKGGLSSWCHPVRLLQSFGLRGFGLAALST